MSYTQFVATATCKVVEGFSLESYLNAISERCVKEENFIFEEYGENDNKVDVDFNEYVRQDDDTIYIEYDTEENNNNADVWDWLIDQFTPIMTSKVMTIKSASIDTRSGVDVHTCFYDKNNSVIEIEDVIEKYLNNL